MALLAGTVTAETEAEWTGPATLAELVLLLGRLHADVPHLLPELKGQWLAELLEAEAAGRVGGFRRPVGHLLREIGAGSLDGLMGLLRAVSWQSAAWTVQYAIRSLPPNDVGADAVILRAGLWHPDLVTRLAAGDGVEITSLDVRDQ